MVDPRPFRPVLARRTLLAAALAALPVAARAESRALRFGIAPVSDTFRLAREADRLTGPLRACLSAPVVVRTAPDFRTFLVRLLKRHYDLALAPAHFVVAAEKRGYVAVCDLDCGEGIVVFGRVASGKPPDLAEVEQATLLLPDPLSLVSLATLAELRRRGLQPGAIRHLRSQRHVIDRVEDGLAEMGAVAASLYELEEAGERGERSPCVEIARFPVALRKTILLAPWFTANARCLRAAFARIFEGPEPPDLGIAVRRVLDPDPALYRELARLLTTGPGDRHSTGKGHDRA